MVFGERKPPWDRKDTMEIGEIPRNFVQFLDTEFRIISLHFCWFRIAYGSKNISGIQCQRNSMDTLSALIGRGGGGRGEGEGWGGGAGGDGEGGGGGIRLISCPSPDFWTKLVIWQGQVSALQKVGPLQNFANKILIIYLLYTLYKVSAILTVRLSEPRDGKLSFFWFTLRKKKYCLCCFLRDWLKSL